MTTKPTAQKESPTREQLLKRASALVPALRGRAPLTEQMRRVPGETVADLLATGLHLLGVPARFGGLNLDYELSLEVGIELGRGCPSASWCYSLWVAHSWLAGYWPLQAQEELFAPGPDVLICSSLSPGRSTCTPVDGGFRLAGRWEFSSGCDSAHWIMLGVPGIGQRNWALVHRQDFEIIDTWFVSGLKGSGSKDIRVEDAFIPAHRVLDVAAAGDQDRTGWEIHGQDRYRVPIPALLGWDLVAPMIGLARGMMEEFAGRLTGTSGPGRTAESATVQLRLSQAAAEVDAAQAVMERDVREAIGKGSRGEPFSNLERARYRRDKAFATQLCLHAVNRIFDLSGGHALFDSDPLQRFHRDAQAIAHRDTLIMDVGGLQYGRAALGLEPDGSI